MAIAAAATMGVDPRVSAAAVAGVSEVDGRYRRVRHRDHDVRLLLAKNPAGWRESLDLATESEADAHVLSINARTADGTDPSWLWDVDFTGLTGRRVAVIGDRAADLSVRLLYAGVPHTVHAGLDGALAALPDDPVVDVHATYTAFRDLLVELNHD
jgi:UDP-N-acetylmuramyl tripeptide synthase